MIFIIFIIKDSSLVLYGRFVSISAHVAPLWVCKHQRISAYFIYINVSISIVGLPFCAS